jgi:hypothetical protein
MSTPSKVSIKINLNNPSYTDDGDLILMPNTPPPNDVDTNHFNAGSEISYELIIAGAILPPDESSKFANDPKLLADYNLERAKIKLQNWKNINKLKLQLVIPMIQRDIQAQQLRKRKREEEEEEQQQQQQQQLEFKDTQDVVPPSPSIDDDNDQTGRNLVVLSDVPEEIEDFTPEVVQQPPPTKRLKK